MGAYDNMMATVEIQLAPSVENAEERTFHNSIPSTTPQSLAHTHCLSAVQ